MFPFVLDRYEVTVGRYRKFVAAFGAGFRPAKGSGKDRNNPQDQGWNFELGESVLPRADAFATWTDSVGANESRPVNQLPWLSAFAFCIWDRGRLPTQEEWLEAAGGGEQHRYYPWSNPPTDKTVDSAHASYDCTADGSAQGACSSADLSIVGSHPLGNGRFGHADLGGNVWEWVREPGKPADVARACGGAFFDIADLVRVQCMSGPPNMGQGVRCAR